MSRRLRRRRPLKTGKNGFQTFAKNSIRAQQEFLVERKIFDQKEVEYILTRITGATDLDAVKDADLIIEAVFEDNAVKKGLFKTLDGIYKPATVVDSRSGWGRFN